MMHEKKKAFLEVEQGQMDRMTKGVEAIPDALLEIEGVTISAGICGDYPKLIVSDCETAQDLFDILHKITEVAGKYEMRDYWIPYEGCLCVTYIFSGLKVRFSINNSDLEPIVKVFSNGKCRISKEEKVTIVCDL